jgi:hypothetical protein
VELSSSLTVNHFADGNRDATNIYSSSRKFLATSFIISLCENPFNLRVSASPKKPSVESVIIRDNPPNPFHPRSIKKLLSENLFNLRVSASPKNQNASPKPSSPGSFSLIPHNLGGFS